MKILHTSDWHLGHRLHENSQFEEQSLFLEWLLRYIDAEKVDVLLVAGDIFDTGVPSTQSQKMYYDFLIKLTHTSCNHVVITAGNHDAPGTINAPKALLGALSVYVVGRASEELAEEVFNLRVGDEDVIVAAVPYLRDQDIRRALAGETFEELGERYKTALTRHYAEVAEYCQRMNEHDAALIALGHLFAIGGTPSESEQSIYVGNLGDIHADDFPQAFDYIALGHLHRPQRVNKLDHIRYSGSPNMLSFSEVHYDKKVLMLHVEKAKLQGVQEISVPVFRKMAKITGTLAECIAHLKELDAEQHDLTPWVEVVLDTDGNHSLGFSEIQKLASELRLEVLKVSLKNERRSQGLEHLVESSKHVKELSPAEVFKLKCKEQEFDLDQNTEILDAFNEVLQEAQNS